MNTTANCAGWASASVLVRIQARDRRGATGAFRVEFNIDRTFVERMQQLRSLVPPVRNLTAHRDLEIDKVRARMPTAQWWDSAERLPVDKSSVVLSSDGDFVCLATARRTLQLCTASIPVARIVQLESMHMGGLGPGIPFDLTPYAALRG